MSESEERKRKKDKKEKKAKKEKKREKEKIALAAGVGQRRGGGNGLEEVYEDDYGQQRRGGGRFDDADDGAHDHSLDMDDLDAPRRGGRRDHDGDRQHGHANGGMEIEDEQLDLDDELMAEMDEQAAELDLDYHPPPPKTTQQVALAGVALILLGMVEMFLFGYLSTPGDVWCLVASSVSLLVCGVFAIRAANTSTVMTARHYRFALQVYMVLIFVLSILNITIINVQPCIAPCIYAAPSLCVQPVGAVETCARMLVNTIAICAFGLFFPLFLFCLPCYLGSGIHIDNLQSQEATQKPTTTGANGHPESTARYRPVEEESKY